ncbi:MAG: pentapeptide repeat-containing protein [Prochlorococcus sp.]|nr:pentapeptide repeat-containing protein [Prochlorococcaceae cyanobacterium Fu_MAG_50]
MDLRKRLLALLSIASLALSSLLFAPPQPAWATMDYAKQVLIGSDFSGLDLRGVIFNLTNLRRADLSGSDLSGASLFGAKLQEADLSDTNLREATLDSANLDGTNLSNAVLEDAFAFNTRFTNVTITGADFTNVPLRGDVLRTLCATAEGTNPTTGRTTRESLGCS